jgi:hypothetical protein
MLSPTHQLICILVVTSCIIQKRFGLVDIGQRGTEHQAYQPCIAYLSVVSIYGNSKRRLTLMRVHNGVNSHSIITCYVHSSSSVICQTHDRSTASHHHQYSVTRQVHSQSSSSVICQTTVPQPLPKRFLHLMRSRASSF